MEHTIDNDAATIETTEHFQRAMADMEREQERVRGLLMKCEPVMRRADEALAAVRAAGYMDQRTSEYTGPTVTLGYWRDRFSAHVLWSVHGLNGFDELALIVEIIERASGVRFQRHSDDPDMRRRSLYDSGDTWKYTTRLIAFVRGDADNGCKVVETGEVKPVLKFVCPGDADYPEVMRR